MITILDIETTSKGPGKSPSPFWPDNYLVSVGYKAEEDIEEYLCFNHSFKKADPHARKILQEQLDKTILLVGHNIGFDLQWLWECDFKYEKNVYDTMAYEYLFNGSMSTKLDLSSCCRRHGINSKLDLSQELKDKNGFEHISWEKVEKYGRNDVDITKQLFEAQLEELTNEEYY